MEQEVLRIDAFVPDPFPSGGERRDISGVVGDERQQEMPVRALPDDHSEGQRKGGMRELDQYPLAQEPGQVDHEPVEPPRIERSNGELSECEPPADVRDDRKTRPAGKLNG